MLMIEDWRRENHIRIRASDDLVSFEPGGKMGLFKILPDPDLTSKPKSGSPFENNPLAQAILREGLAIQDRFSAEPVYVKTGKGYLKSVGVSELKELKNSASPSTTHIPDEFELTLD